MTTTERPQRTALTTQVAATGNAVTFSDMERMAQSITKSGLFGIKNVDQAIALMVVAQAEGTHPALVARDYDIIQGRPSKKSEAMLRAFMASGGHVQWHELTDTKADATFSHPAGGTVRIDWDMPRADRAGLTSKNDSMYKKYPRAMLRSRVVSEGCRAVCPSSTSGMYTPEEAADIPEITDITPQRVEDAIEGAANVHLALTETERLEHINAMRDAPTQETLAHAFASAWKHGSEAKDEGARQAFKAVYEGKKSELTALAADGAK